MKASEARLLDLLAKGSQFVHPDLPADLLLDR
jgi:hypothetical protein